LGHTHTFLDKPTVTNRIGEEVLVNQVGLRNKFRIDFFFDKRAKSTGKINRRLIVP
jgi:hypothetical protein